MKYFLSFILTISLLSHLSAQTVVLEDDDPKKVYEETDWGPNQQHFGCWFVNYGLPVPVNTESSLKTASSGHWNFGYAYKMKIFAFMDIGGELSYSNYFYALDASSRETIAPNKDWDKIRSKQNGMKANLFFRFYMSPRRGNYLGTYLDLGFYTDYHMSSGWMYKLKDDFIKEKVSLKQNEDFETLIYGPSLAFGRDQFNFFAQYNVNSVLTSKSSFPEMPAFVCGLKINMYSAF